MGWRNNKTPEEQAEADRLRKAQILATLDSPIGHCSSADRAFVKDEHGNPVSACQWPRTVNELLDKILQLERALDAERRKNS